MLKRFVIIVIVVKLSVYAFTGMVDSINVAKADIQHSSKIANTY